MVRRDTASFATVLEYCHAPLDSKCCTVHSWQLCSWPQCAVHRGRKHE